MAIRKNKLVDAENIFFNFQQELQQALNGIAQDVFDKTQVGIGKAADFMKDRLEDATPVDTAQTKKQWVRTTEYKNVQYIGNNAVTEKGIPIVNLLEFNPAPRGRPFVRKTFKSNANEALQIIKDEITK